MVCQEEEKQEPLKDLCGLVNEASNLKMPLLNGFRHGSPNQRFH